MSKSLVKRLEAQTGEPVAAIVTITKAQAAYVAWLFEASMRQRVSSAMNSGNLELVSKLTDAEHTISPAFHEALKAAVRGDIEPPCSYPSKS
jgi:hypothetical protein